MYKDNTLEEIVNILKHTHKCNLPGIDKINFFLHYLSPTYFAHSAWAIEYTDCTSTEV